MNNKDMNKLVGYLGLKKLFKELDALKGPETQLEPQIIAYWFDMHEKELRQMMNNYRYPCDRCFKISSVCSSLTLRGECHRGCGFIE